MAITLITEPQKYMPGFNPIQFVVDGSNKSACDFQYIADLYINSVFVIRLKEFSQGTNDYGYFNIERILQDYLSHDLNTNLFGFQDSPNGIVSYYLEFRERYGTASPCDGILTTQSVSYTSSVKYAWNGALQRVAYYNYVLGTYVCAGVLSKFLTSAPTTKLIRSDDRLNLDFIQDIANPVGRVTIKTYNFSNVIISTYTIDNPYSVPGNAGELKLSVGVGPYNLNEATLTSGTQPIITSSVKYYTIQLYDKASPAAVISELRTFTIDPRCSKYETKSVWWWNRLGAYEMYSFIMKSTRSVDISRKVFDRFLSTDYSLTERGTTISGIDAQEKFTFKSDWLTESEGLWMEELFTSPETYLSITEPDPVSFQTCECDVSLTVLIHFNQDPGLATGTVFRYTITNYASIGSPASGTATITGFDQINDSYETDIPCSILFALITGGTITVQETRVMPIVIDSPTFDERLKLNVKSISYTVEARPSYKLNIQNQ